MHYGTDPREYLYEEMGAIEQANALLDSLRSERPCWRGNPVMTAKLDKLVAMAERRVERRVRAEQTRIDADWRWLERDARQSAAAADEDMPF